MSWLLKNKMKKSTAKIPHFTLRQRLRLAKGGVYFFHIQTDATAQELTLLNKFALKIPNGGILVEIGSYLGASSLVMSRANKNNTLYCIDTWNNDAMSEGKWDTMNSFLHNTRHCKNIVPLRMWSTEAISVIPKQFDMIFIDGDHSYDGVKKDIDLYFPRLKSGGIITMHDFGWAEGVQQVIKEDIRPNVSEEGTLPNLYWGRKK